jgi:hypothetical protein
MNPQAMGDMMNLMNNPEMMGKMGEMMKNPEIQELLNNPDLMSNMMNIFGNNLDGTDPLSTPTPLQKLSKGDCDDYNDVCVEPNCEGECEVDSKFKSEDIVILTNLKSELYNGQRGIVECYNNENNRYIVLLDEEDKKIMVKEDNLELEIVEIVEPEPGKPVLSEPVAESVPVVTDTEQVAESVPVVTDTEQVAESVPVVTDTEQVAESVPVVEPVAVVESVDVEPASSN